MIACSKLSYMEGVLLFIFSGIMCVPLIIDATFSNMDGCCAFALGSIACAFLGGVFFFAARKPKDFQMTDRERIVFIVVNWMILPIIAGLPLLMSPVNMPMIDVLFEITSAVSCAGGSIIPDTAVLSSGLIFWRSFLQLIGCLFFIVSNMFIFSKLSELIIPNLTANSDRSTVFGLIKVLAAIYFGVSFAGVLMLIGNGLKPLDACCYSFAAISGGGLVPSGAAAESSSLRFVMTVLMFISGVSVVFFRNIAENSNAAETQFRWYTGIICLAVLSSILAGGNLSGAHLFDEIQKSLFNVVSSVTTNGISLGEEKGRFANSFMYLLNFLGGSFGSGTGGVKILRCILVFELVKGCLTKIVNPNTVCVPVYNGQKIDTPHLSSLFTYFSLYILLALLLSCCLTFSDFDFNKSFSSVITSMNGNGPYFGLIKALPEQLSALTAMGKITLIFSMLAGRLEFVPFFIILMRSFWKKGK